MSFPDVSIVFPVFDERAAFLRQAVDSILGQDFENFELLILNDGSKADETLATLDEISKADSRILRYDFEHEGLTATLNKGLRLASAEIISRMDSNDWYEPDRLSRQLDFLAKHPDIGIVGSSVTYHRADGKKLWTTRLPESRDAIERALFSGCPFVHAAVCYRTRAVLAVGGYRSDLIFSEDYDLFWRLVEHSGGANLAAPLTHVRFFVGSKSNREAFDQEREILAIRALAKMRAAGAAENLEEARAFAASILPDSARASYGESRRGDFALLAGNYREALFRTMSAVLSSPFQLKGYLKLLRVLSFICCPPLRQLLFSNTAKQFLAKVGIRA